MREAVEFLRAVDPFIYGVMIGAAIGYVVGLVHGRSENTQPA